MILKNSKPIIIISLIILSVCVQASHIQDFSFIQKFKHKRLDYPIRFTYINRITDWWPPSNTLAQMAVPGYAQTHSYNYVALTFWTCQKGPTDISKMWDDPIKYFGFQLGKDKIEVQNFLKKKYNQGRVSIILSAFGASQYPTTLGLDPVECANKLGNYVKQNNYDGVDIDYQDNKAMNAGKGEQWLIKFMYQLRQVIPFHIISHAPQAPYFANYYPSGGYKRVHREVGHLIDFYNLQFYNQVNSTYETYELLFKNSGIYSPQTSVSQISKIGGVPLDMIVVGKPASAADVYNTGYTRPSQLARFFVRANLQLGWNAGFMFWQYYSDREGIISNQLGQIMKCLNNYKNQN